MEFIQIEVKQRDARGSRDMTRLRAAGQTPAVLYGLKRRNLPLSIPTDALSRFLQTGSHLVELKMGFNRVDKLAEVEDQVPVVFKGIAPGTKSGGMFQGLMDSLKLKARPRDLPREILVEINHLEVGDEVKVSDIAAMPGVTVLDSPDEMIAHCVAMRGLEEDEDDADVPAATEPELIGKEGEESSES
jgi:large subunit ribosomal protein L25